MMRFIDLFCGIGGFRVALERLGHTCVFSSEINEKAKESYRANFGETPSCDITKITASEIPAHDVLCAGFPCQPFSLAGNRKGFEDNRGMLFFEILRIAKHHKTPILFLENVPNLLKTDDGNTFDKMVLELRKLGYEVHYNLLNSSYFGIPQSRKRLYIVCLMRHLGLKYTPPKPFYTPVTLSDFLDKKIDYKTIISPLLMSKVKIKKIARQLTLTGEEVISLKPLRIGIVGSGGQGQIVYSAKGHAVC